MWNPSLWFRTTPLAHSLTAKILGQSKGAESGKCARMRAIICVRNLVPQITHCKISHVLARENNANESGTGTIGTFPSTRMTSWFCRSFPKNNAGAKRVGLRLRQRLKKPRRCTEGDGQPVLPSGTQVVPNNPCARGHRLVLRLN